MTLKVSKIAPLADLSTRFADPIFIQNRQQPLRTLRDAAQFITALPKAERQATAWQAAAGLLTMITERGGDPMFARLAMMRALHQRDPQAAMTTPKADEEFQHCPLGQSPCKGRPSPASASQKAI